MYKSFPAWKTKITNEVHSIFSYQHNPLIIIFVFPVRSYSLIMIYHFLYQMQIDKLIGSFIQDVFTKKKILLKNNATNHVRL